MMRANKADRRISGPLMIFLVVYIAAFGLLLAPKGTFVQVSVAVAGTQ